MSQTKEHMKATQERAKAVTLEQIAQRAGVASRTVSDALKGQGRVAASTRENVLRIARELNYVPNAAARALATGRTGTIAVLSGPLDESYYANMVQQLGSHLTANSYEMLLLPTQRSTQELVRATANRFRRWADYYRLKPRCRRISAKERATSAALRFGRRRQSRLHRSHHARFVPGGARGFATDEQRKSPAYRLRHQ